MEQKTPKLYRFAPLMISELDLEQKLEKKLKDLNSFNNSINNIKEMITSFKDKNHKRKQKYKNYKTPNPILTTVDSIVIIGLTSTSRSLSVTGLRLIIFPISASIARGLFLAEKFLFKMFLKNILITNNTMKMIHKPINLLRDYVENVYKIA